MSNDYSVRNWHFTKRILFTHICTALWVSLMKLHSWSRQTHNLYNVKKKKNKTSCILYMNFISVASRSMYDTSNIYSKLSIEKCSKELLNLHELNMWTFYFFFSFCMPNFCTFLCINENISYFKIESIYFI